MSQPYLDSAGNVSSAVASDLQNFAFAIRAAAIVPSAATSAAATMAGTVVNNDAITGLAQTVTDV
jgi:hypothetical protein